MPITKEFPYYSQVTTFSTSKGALGEHNVIRDGEWIVRFVEGEFRYNVVTDIVDHDLMQNGSAGRVHHNLFLAGTSDHRHGAMSACIAVVYAPKKLGEGIEIFNNVFHGGGRLHVATIDEPADPHFPAPIPKGSRCSAEGVKARKVRVAKTLPFYRAAYSPAAGSPLIGAGDPADGEGTSIGAIGAARPSDQDRFGR